ncbi:MAG TPA: methylisocitrate lyase [Gemmatales bacterium]|nr:methylisocitrate lyase [Gemmatales bacterium]HMP59940.1 methylisocitrate lyase [Gemmatales bacterium]
MPSLGSQARRKANPTPGQRLRAAMKAGPLMVPGVINALHAKMAERAGFQAIYLSGAVLSATLGMPDVGLVTANEFIDQCRHLTAATSLPLISDADTGFGEALNVERVVKQFCAAGVAGIHLEDQEMPKRCGHLSGKRLVSSEAMCAKLRAAAAARTDPGFVLIARTDARGVTGFDDAVERARAYLEAGADVIFVEALKSAEEFRLFALAVEGPLLANMTEFGQSPPLPFNELARMGYRLVIYPVTAFRLAMKAAEVMLATLKAEGTQESLVPHMLTRQELYDYLGYAGYEERDRVYFAPSAPS